MKGSSIPALGLLILSSRALTFPSIPRQARLWGLRGCPHRGSHMGADAPGSSPLKATHQSPQSIPRKAVQAEAASASRAEPCRRAGGLHAHREPPTALHPPSTVLCILQASLLCQRPGYRQRFCTRQETTVPTGYWLLSLGDGGRHVLSRVPPPLLQPPCPWSRASCLCLLSEHLQSCWPSCKDSSHRIGAHLSPA